MTNYKDKYPINILNNIGSALGSETEKAYPIDTLNEISKALGGTGESKYPADALNEIASVLQSNDSAEGGLRDILMKHLLTACVSSPYRNKFLNATIPQMLAVINNGGVGASTTLDDYSSESLIEGLSKLLSRDTIQHVWYNTDGTRSANLVRMYDVKPRNVTNTKIIHSPKYPLGVHVSRILFSNTYLYFSKYNNADNTLSVFEEDFLTGTLSKAVVKLEYRLKDQSLVLPDNGNTYKDGVMTELWMTRYVDGQPQTPVKLGYGNAGTCGYNLIPTVDGLGLKYVYEVSGGHSMSVYLKQSTSDEPISLKKGDTIGVAFGTTQFFEQVPWDFLDPVE